MLPEVESLLSDSGELLAASGLAASAGRWATVVLEFARGTLRLACNDDTDEVVVSADAGQLDAGIPIDEVDDLIGMTVEYAWELRNQRGYTDGFQLRLIAQDGRLETRQFEVAASAMDIRRVTE
jgi:hypothetical protein